MILFHLRFISFAEGNCNLKYIAMTTDQLAALPLFISFPPFSSPAVISTLSYESPSPVN